MFFFFSDLIELNDGQFLFGYYVDKLEEVCGVFGIYVFEEVVVKLIYFGFYVL